MFRIGFRMVVKRLRVGCRVGLGWTQSGLKDGFRRDVGLRQGGFKVGLFWVRVWFKGQGFTSL